MLQRIVILHLTLLNFLKILRSQGGSDQMTTKRLPPCKLAPGGPWSPPPDFANAMSFLTQFLNQYYSNSTREFINQRVVFFFWLQNRLFIQPPTPPPTIRQQVDLCNQTVEKLRCYFGLFLLWFSLEWFFNRNIKKIQKSLKFPSSLYFSKFLSLIMSWECPIMSCVKENEIIEMVYLKLIKVVRQNKKPKKITNFKRIS